MVEVFIESFAVIEYGKVVSLLRCGRFQVQMAIAFEYCASDLAIDLSVKSEVASTEGKRGCIAMKFEVVDRHNFAAGQQAAELLIKGV